jgi:hypothetical protein
MRLCRRLPAAAIVLAPSSEVAPSHISRLTSFYFERKTTSGGQKSLCRGMSLALIRTMFVLVAVVQ